MEENRCPQCGANVDAGAYACKYCGAPLPQAQQAQQPPAQPPVQPPYAVPQQPYVVQQPVMVPAGYPQKSKIAAGLLGIFLGAFGVHNFYLGYTTKAVIQVCVSGVSVLLACCTAGVTFLGTFGMAIWGLVEGIMILTGHISTDAKGTPLV